MHEAHSPENEKGTSPQEHAGDGGKAAAGALDSPSSHARETPAGLDQSPVHAKETPPVVDSSPTHRDKAPIPTTGAEPLSQAPHRQARPTLGSPGTEGHHDTHTFAHVTPPTATEEAPTAKPSPTDKKTLGSPKGAGLGLHLTAVLEPFRKPQSQPTNNQPAASPGSVASKTTLPPSADTQGVTQTNNGSTASPTVHSGHQDHHPAPPPGQGNNRSGACSPPIPVLGNAIGDLANHAGLCPPTAKSTEAATSTASGASVATSGPAPNSTTVSSPAQTTTENTATTKVPVHIPTEPNEKCPFPLVKGLCPPQAVPQTTTTTSAAMQDGQHDHPGPAPTQNTTDHKAMHTSSIVTTPKQTLTSSTTQTMTHTTTASSKKSDQHMDPTKGTTKSGSAGETSQTQHSGDGPQLLMSLEVSATQTPHTIHSKQAPKTAATVTSSTPAMQTNHTNARPDMPTPMLQTALNSSQSMSDSHLLTIASHHTGLPFFAFNDDKPVRSPSGPPPTSAAIPTSTPGVIGGFSTYSQSSKAPSPSESTSGSITASASGGSPSASHSKNPHPSGHSGHNGHRLPPSAIVPISVSAAVVCVAAIGALLAFLLCRHNRKRASRGLNSKDATHGSITYLPVYSAPPDPRYDLENNTHTIPVLPKTEATAATPRHDPRTLSMYMYTAQVEKAPTNAMTSYNAVYNTSNDRASTLTHSKSVSTTGTLYETVPIQTHAQNDYLSEPQDSKRVASLTPSVTSSNVHYGVAL